MKRSIFTPTWLARLRVRNLRSTAGRMRLDPRNATSTVSSHRIVHQPDGTMLHYIEKRCA